MQIQDANTEFGINANAAKHKLKEFIFKKNNKHAVMAWLWVLLSPV